LLTDVATDAEVAARDREISDANFVRLRRALDRSACAQSVLEPNGAENFGASDGKALRMRIREEAVAPDEEGLREFRQMYR
jgi:hypothetical protein